MVHNHGMGIAPSIPIGGSTNDPVPGPRESSTIAEPACNAEPPAAILAHEFSDPFVEKMRQAVIVSYFKYGAIRDAAGKINFIASANERFRKYAETGNTEWLVDAANYAMFEYMHPSHPEAHFRGTDAGESPGRIVTRTNQVDHGKNVDIGKVYVSPLQQFR